MLATGAPGYVYQNLGALLPGVELHRGLAYGCLDARHILRHATAGERCTWACHVASRHGVEATTPLMYGLSQTRQGCVYQGRWYPHDTKCSLADAKCNGAHWRDNLLTQTSRSGLLLHIEVTAAKGTCSFQRSSAAARAGGGAAPGGQTR